MREKSLRVMICQQDRFERYLLKILSDVVSLGEHFSLQKIMLTSRENCLSFAIGGVRKKVLGALGWRQERTINKWT